MLIKAVPADVERDVERDVAREVVKDVAVVLFVRLLLCFRWMDGWKCLTYSLSVHLEKTLFAAHTSLQQEQLHPQWTPGQL